MKKEKREKENSKNYFLFIYWNPEDKRIFVPKRWGFGWTVNFANPLSIAALFIILIVISVLSKLI